ncbi:MAG: septum formation protein Maf [Chlorobi bacterium]|nr:septum formation protein Maf [Chlorobiota bacterium]
MNRQSIPLILVSASPRRRRLLEQLGLSFQVFNGNVDESVDPDLSPQDHVCLVAERKTRSAEMVFPGSILLGADTIVAYNGMILNKPSGPEEAVEMLATLSGNCHEVYTAYYLLHPETRKHRLGWERTEVWFRKLGEDEIKDYVASGSPLDKAGAYGIQDDFGAVFVEKIHGCYYNVVGLPLSRMYVDLMNLWKEIRDVE